jgi:hypothetical protein
VLIEYLRDLRLWIGCMMCDQILKSPVWGLKLLINHAHVYVMHSITVTLLYAYICCILHPIIFRRRHRFCIVSRVLCHQTFCSECKWVVLFVGVEMVTRRSWDHLRWNSSIRLAVQRYLHITIVLFGRQKFSKGSKNSSVSMPLSKEDSLWFVRSGEFYPSRGNVDECLLKDNRLIAGMLVLSTERSDYRLPRQKVRTAGWPCRSIGYIVAGRCMGGVADAAARITCIVQCKAGHYPWLFVLVT